MSYDPKVLLANRFAGFFTFGLFDYLNLMWGVHCHFVLVIIVITIIIAFMIISFWLLLLLLSGFLNKNSLLFLRGKLNFFFYSFNFFMCLNLIYATTIWCWGTISISFWHQLLWHEGKGHRPDYCCHLTNIIPDSISSDNWEVGKSLRFLKFFFYFHFFSKGSWH